MVGGMTDERRFRTWLLVLRVGIAGLLAWAHAPRRAAAD